MYTFVSLCLWYDIVGYHCIVSIIYYTSVCKEAGVAALIVGKVYRCVYITEANCGGIKLPSQLNKTLLY